MLNIIMKFEHAPKKHCALSFLHSTYAYILLFCFVLQSISLVAEEPPSEGDQLYSKAKSVLPNVDSFSYYMNQAKEAYGKEENWGQVVNAYNGLWAIHWNLGDKELAATYPDSMLSIAKTKIKDQEDKRAYAARGYSSKALMDNVNGFYDASIQNYEAAIQELDAMQDPDPEEIGTKLNNLAKVYTDKGDYSKALASFQRSLKLVPTDAIDKKATILNNIGFSFLRLEQYVKAKQFLSSAFKLFRTFSLEELGSNTNLTGNYINNCNNLGAVYLNLEQFDSTEYFLSSAMKLQDEEQENQNLSLTYLYFGQLYQQIGQAQKGIQFLKTGLNSALEQHQLPNTYVARCYFQLAYAYELQKEAQTALEYYTKSTEALVRGELENELPLQIDSVVSDIELLKALSRKAALLWQEYKSNGASSNLTQAFQHYEFISALITKTRQSYLEEQSKLFLSEKSHSIYGQAIQVAHELYKNKKELVYAEAVLNFMERDKASTLLESIRDNEARMFTNLRVDEAGRNLLEQEEVLKREITNFKRLIYEAENKGDKKLETKIEKWNEALFQRKEQFQEIRKALEARFPDYYQLKYATEIASIQGIQKTLLDGKSALVEYYLNQEHLIALVITTSGVYINELELEAANFESIEIFLGQISSFDFEKQPELAYQAFCNSAFDTYSLLLKPLDGLDWARVERLTIIPDGIINFVSFQALLKTLPESLEKVDYSTYALDYLLEELSINYAYSSSQLYFYKKRKRDRRSTNIFAGFAPDFGGIPTAKAISRSCDADHLSPLSENRKEVESIAALFGKKSTIYLGADASSKQFKSIASDYRVLHLATHACSQADSSLYQKIYFGDRDYLYGFDLYDLNIAADLVVLSACETGIGELVQGEGVLSLARGFAYAGSPSILTSLWSVSDYATSEMMVKYYEYLEMGKAKSTALQAAQKDFMAEQSSTFMHPVFWAGFVQVGSDEALFSSTISILWPRILPLALVGLVLFFYFYRKRQL